MTPKDEHQDRILASGGDAIREQDKIQLVLAYLGCLCLVPFLTVKDSPFVAWHAKQGLVLFGAEVAVGVLGMLLSSLGGGCMAGIVNLALLVVSVLAIIRALKGERWRLPLLADLAEKL